MTFFIPLKSMLPLIKKREWRKEMINMVGNKLEVENVYEPGQNHNYPHGYVQCKRGFAWPMEHIVAVDEPSMVTLRTVPLDDIKNKMSAIKSMFTKIYPESQTSYTRAGKVYEDMGGRINDIIRFIGRHSQIAKENWIQELITGDFSEKQIENRFEKVKKYVLEKKEAFETSSLKDRQRFFNRPMSEMPS